ncbi:MAG: o-succinylbenzoate--CoA ligase [Rhizobiaceae bacterium]|nr:o-succinylbenzoate--CoA ligase [Rhizobiaceae bacterium]
MTAFDPTSHVIGRLLESRARISAAACAVVTEDGARVSFAELEARSNGLAHLLAGMGIARGDRVGLFVPNGLAFIEFFLALAKLGAVTCALNTRLAASELASVVRDSDLSLAVVHPTLSDLAGQALAGQAIPVLSTGADRPADLPDTPPTAQVEPTDTLVLVYTSGTTGRPKAVMITHEQMFWASLTMTASLDFRLGDVHLLPVPMFHVGGLSFICHSIHLGITLVVPMRWNAERVAQLIEEEKVDHFFAVPTMLLDLLGIGDDEASTRLRSVRWILTGAAPTPPSLIQRYAAFGIPVMQSYGATETCGPGLFVDQAHATAKAGAIGRPFFHTEMRLVGDDGAPSRIGKPGELQLKGKHVFAGYRNDPEATRQAFTEDGWLRTGDIGRQDEDDFVHLVDRRKNLIISGGENVYPREVEQVLETHPAVREVAVVGTPDARWGERVTALVVARPQSPTSQHELLEFCADRLARYKIPKALFFVDSLPVNATGKLSRRDIVEMAIKLSRY